MKHHEVNRPHKAGKAERGFTLLELMIVVSIIGVIAALVFPRYQDYILKSRRTDGKTLLSGVAAREEQYFMDNKTYTANPADLGYTANANGNITSEQGFYEVQIAATAVTFNLQAVPQSSQTRDTDCGTLTLDEQQVKGQSGTGTDCW
jgi:type IV pilus assembly protein PilE